MHRTLSLVLISIVAACGGGPRGAVMSAVDARDVGRSLEEYDRFRDDEGGGDPELLGRVAALLLEEAARGEEASHRAAALAQLQMAGTDAEPALERLAASADEPSVQARALSVLASRGDGDARDRLRALVDSDDPAVLAEAVGVLDAGEDTERLLSLLQHTSADVRSAAARQLENAAPAGPVRAALAEAARVDPLPRVRAAAVRSLGAFGAPAFEPLRGRLSDEDSQVRMAAVGALVRADPERALAAIGPLLEMTPTPAGVEAARVLAGRGGEGATNARAFLRRALRTADADVRAQAAVALSSLTGDDSLREALVDALREESDGRVTLSLASILIEQAATREAARSALREMMEGEGMEAVQAASVLARHDGDGGAVRVLASAMQDGEPPVRRAAARALARDAMKPDMARAALRDDDPLVRIHAAGAILSAASALG